MKQEVSIYNQDILAWLDVYNGPKFKFVFSDPPYEINHLGGWDKNGIAFSPELYAGLNNAMLPGAFICLYGYSRTHHRVMVALEDAGFILHKTIFAWVYTSGNPLGAKNAQRKVDNRFTKSYGGYCKCGNPIKGKAVEANITLKHLHNEVHICTQCSKPIREIISEVKWGKTGGMKNLGGNGYGNDNTQVIAKSMTPEAELLKPYSYGLAWSKPMLEPVILAQKPFDTGDQVDGILKYGTGVVNVHEARHTNRWPGNFIAVHAPDCPFSLTGQCNCGIGDYAQQDAEFYEKIPSFGYTLDDNSASAIDYMLYDSKPNKKERDNGLTKANTHPSVKPLSVGEYLGKLFLPPAEFGERHALVPFSGSGSEIASLIRSGWDSVTGVENNRTYCEISERRVGSLTSVTPTILIS